MRAAGIETSRNPPLGRGARADGQPLGCAREVSDPEDAQRGLPAGAARIGLGSAREDVARGGDRTCGFRGADRKRRSDGHPPRSDERPRRAGEGVPMARLVVRVEMTVQRRLGEAGRRRTMSVVDLVKQERGRERRRQGPSGGEEDQRSEASTAHARGG